MVLKKMIFREKWFHGLHDYHGHCVCLEKWHAGNSTAAGKPTPGYLG